MLGGFFRHGSNALLASAAAAIAGASAAGALKMRPGAVVAGVALFFASEYGTHRFLFHAKPSRVPFVLRLQHRLHYDHHVDPAKLELLFLPPWFLGPSLSLSAALSALATRGNRDLTASVVLGNLLGLLYYEWVHYVAHVPFRPVTPFGRWIRKYHLRHHFQNEKRSFGVTNPLLDRLAATYVPVAAAERSETTRLLFPDAFPDLAAR
jgi:sterol desaturase/sphingolipid hydroxylase (fatty acid hydroxylase superfamily)